MKKAIWLSIAAFFIFGLTAWGATATGEREKIDSPDQIKDYREIIKKGIALWGVRRITTVASSSPLVRLENSTCVVAAIDTKDRAVMSLVTSSAVSLNAAISVRSACQQKAVQSTERQKAALEACIKDFRIARKNLQASSKRSQQEIWSIYRTSLKNCQRSASLTTSTKAFEGELLIEDGGNDFMDTAVDSQVK